MIEISNFSKKYSDVSVYEDFNVSFEEGRITCILGESGSGKTTLLNAVAGLTDYKGNITKRKCSYVFQSPRLLPNLTVFDNLQLVCKDANKINKMLERLELGDKSNSYPLKLSGGQAQRAAIARAFLYESEAILMDEPFSSLDLRLKNQITELFFDIWREDKRTVLFVTHEVDEAVRIAQRIIVVNKGKVVYDCNIPTDILPRSAEQAEPLRKQLISVLV